jgi:ATP-dependent DNA helicase RecG
MANTRTGGALIFGIADTGGQVVGLKDPNASLDLILRAARMLKPVLTFGTSPTTYLLDGKTVLVVEVPRNQGTLYQSSGVCWVRKGTHTVPMSVEEISLHLNAAGALQWETALCRNAMLDDLDLRRLDQYLELRDERSRQNLRHSSPEEILVSLRCAARDPMSGALRPTNVGVLMFGNDPQFRIPQSEIVCVRFTDTFGVGKYENRRIINGTLIELVDQAAEFVRQYMAIGAEIIGFKRVDLPEYPFEALREAIVNAIVHRDYSLEGQAIRVFFYTDRVEIRSPGRLPFGVTIEEIVQLRAQSQPRNPVIAQFLRDIPGYMERIGMGIRMMVEEMRQLGLPNPEFVEQHEFAVIFRNGRDVHMEHVPFKPRQILGLDLIRQKGSITSSEYMEATGASESTALRELRDMVARGAILARGKTRGVRYYLP